MHFNDSLLVLGSIIKRNILSLTRTLAKIERKLVEQPSHAY